MQQVRYTVEHIRSGQSRPYADTVNEYLIHVEAILGFGKTKEERENWHPWLLCGDLDAQKQKEIEDTRAGRIRITRIGHTQESYYAEQKAYQVAWAKKIVKALCQDFCEGKEGGWASPKLQTLSLDVKAGTIRVVIREAYTD